MVAKSSLKQTELRSKAIGHWVGVGGGGEEGVLQSLTHVFMRSDLLSGVITA